MPKPRFRTLGKYEDYQVILPATTELVERGGQQVTQVNDGRRVHIKRRPTRVTEEEADALRDHRDFGTFFEEVGGEEAVEQEPTEAQASTSTEEALKAEVAKLKAQLAASPENRVVEETGGEDGAAAAAEAAVQEAGEETVEAPASEDPSEDETEESAADESLTEAEELAPVESVTDTNGAVEFLLGEGVDKEEMKASNGHFHHAKIESAAKRLGYHFPNYGK